MKKDSRRFTGSGLIRAMQLPEDISKKNILVSMEGRTHLTVENFKGISSYTEEEIRLITKGCRVSVFGRHLKIDSYAKDEIEISGIIDKIEYQ